MISLLQTTLRQAVDVNVIVSLAIVVFNPLNPPYQGDFKEKGISPNQVS